MYNVYYLLRENLKLNEIIIDYFVPKKSGVYVLGFALQSQFIPKYVGRSDNDLNQRLKKHLEKSNYTHFKFLITNSLKETFDYECILYHELGVHVGKLDNKNHPDRPAGTYWNCPVSECNYFNTRNYLYKLIYETLKGNEK